ncbi:MAG: hypothetical protein ACYSW3_29085 [Planctomycetota bacterium]
MKRHKITISIDTEGSYGTTYQATGTVTSEQLVEVFHNIRELRMMSEKGFEDLIAKYAGGDDGE